MRSARTTWALWVGLSLLGMALGGAPALADDETTDEKPSKPLLWVIEGDAPTYLFGTLHLLDARLDKPDPIVASALDACNVFVSEAPLDLSSQMQVQIGMALPAGQTLAAYVGEELYARLKKVVPPAMPEMFYSRFSPLVVASLLELRKYAGAALQGKQPQISSLHAKASKAAKKIDALETVKEQIEVVNKLTQQEHTTLLDGYVTKVEKEEAEGVCESETLVKLYLAGNADEIARLSRAPITKDEALDAKLTKILFDDRLDQLMARLLERRAKTPAKTHFVAIGAGFFGGKAGLIAKLRTKGLTVRRLKPGDALPAVKEPAAAEE